MELVTNNINHDIYHASVMAADNDQQPTPTRSVPPLSESALEPEQCDDISPYMAEFQKILADAEAQFKESAGAWDIADAPRSLIPTKRKGL